jgi:hypothetical protein
MSKCIKAVGRGLLVASSLATLSAVPAQAQFTSGVNSDKKFAITAEAGGFFSSNLYTTSGANLNFGDAFTYGGRLAYVPQPHVAVEVGYMYASMNVSSNTVIGTTGTTDLGSVGLNQIDIDGLFGGGNGKAWGYFALGLGMTITNPNVNSSLALPSGSASPSSETLFSWNLGGGVVLIPKGKVGFRIDGRFRSTDTNHTTSAGGYCTIYGYCYTYATSWYSSGELTGGITVRF